MSFITLTEFLSLADPTDTRSFRSVWRILPHAENWPKYYETAKESFEKFGEAGPPLGSKVITLQPGHNGGPGVVRTFDGVNPDGEQFFQIYYIDDHYRKGDKQYSLVSRPVWWTAIAVIDISPDRNYGEWRNKWGWLNR